MGKRSKRRITNEESCIEEKKLKINKHVTVDPNSKNVDESANEKKHDGIQAVNKLVVSLGNSKKAKLVKVKINKPEEIELNLDDAKDPAKRKETDASSKLAVVKNKKSNIKQHEQVELVSDIHKPMIEKKGKKSKATNMTVDNDGGKAKITLVVCEPQQVLTRSGTTNKKFLNEDEAEVKDEDIDKFCDELDEEDNAQFEDWVKLIEAKLHSNKKK